MRAKCGRRGGGTIFIGFRKNLPQASTMGTSSESIKDPTPLSSSESEVTKSTSFESTKDPVPLSSLESEETKGTSCESNKDPAPS